MIYGSVWVFRSRWVGVYRSGIPVDYVDASRTDIRSQQDGSREGKYPLPPGASKTIMGVEFAGTVTELGDGATSFKEGDEAFGLAYGVGPCLAIEEYG